MHNKLFNIGERFFKETIIIFIIAVTGAGIFHFLHLPVPWLLGPLCSLILFQFLYKKPPLYWPNILRDLGLIVLGLAIGQQFNIALFQNLGIILVYLFLINIILIIGSIGIAYVLSKWSKLSFKSMLLSTIPGGLSQIIIFAQEEKDVDVAAITYFHVARLLLIVFMSSFIVVHHATSKPDVPSNLTIGLFLIIVIAWGCSFLARYIQLPVAYFITPIFLSIVCNLTSVQIPYIPSSLTNIALLCIGTHIGLTLKPRMLKLPIRYLIAGVFSSLGLLGITYGTSLLLMSTFNYTFATSFLSTAPGGLDQMGLLADAVGADVSTVTVFQVFRILFIFLLLLPALRYYFKYTSQKKEKLLSNRMEQP